MSPYFALYSVENNKIKKSVKFQGDMLNFCDFIQGFVFTRNHHLKEPKLKRHVVNLKTEKIQMRRPISVYTVRLQSLKRLNFPYNLVKMFSECTVGWLVVLGLRQYFSLYRAVSQREGERGEKG